MQFLETKKWTEAYGPQSNGHACPALWQCPREVTNLKRNGLWYVLGIGYNKDYYVLRGKKKKQQIPRSKRS